MNQIVHHLTLFVGSYDHRGLLRFPGDDSVRYGFTVPIDENSVSIEEFIKDQVEKFASVDRQHIDLLSILDSVLTDGSGHPPSYLVVVRLRQGALQAPEEWPTLPVILRSMPKGSTRLVYNKAFQLLAGAADSDIAALEVDEEGRLRLQQLLKDGKL